MGWRGEQLVPLILALLTGSCHWVIGHDPQSSSTADLPRADLRGDRAVTREAGRKELGRDLPPRDSRALDQQRELDQKQAKDWKPDQAKDLKPDTFCSDVEGDALTPYACPVPMCPAGDDCDGLPPLRDPYPPPICNSVLFAESFSQASWTTTWGRSFCSDDNAEIVCGRVRFKIPSNVPQAIWTQKTVEASEIVELRFLPPQAPYQLTLRVVDKPLDPKQCMSNVAGSERACKVDDNGGVLTLTSKVLSTPAGNLFSIPAPGWLVLQSYVQAGAHVCRLFSSTKIGEVAATFGGALPNGATVQIEAVNHSAVNLLLDLDWVRIFKL